MQQEITGTPDKQVTRQSQPWFVLAMLAVGVVLAALDLTVVVAILTTMMKDLDVAITDIDQGAWIVSAYLLAYTVTIPFMGRVSDVIGRRGVFLGALLVFVAGSVLAAIANSLPLMIAARTIQALGGGAMVPVSMAVVGDIFPPQRRGLALGIIGAADTAGWVFGPLYGSFMLKFFGWHTIFWLNVPLGILSGILIFFALRPTTAPIAPATVPKSSIGQIDLLGFVFLAVALIAFNLALGGGKDTAALGGASLDQIGQNPLKQYQIPILIVALVALVIFVVVELRVANPLLHLRSFLRPTYSLANLVNLVVGGALVAALVGVALFVNATDRSDNIVDIAFHSAVALAPLTLLMALGAVVGGWLSDRFGYSPVTIAGLVIIAGGFWLMSTWGSNLKLPDNLFSLFPGAGVAGLGFGLVIAPIGSAVIDWAERADIGVAAGLVLVMRLVGMTLGVSLLTTWALNRYEQLKPKTVDFTKITADDLSRPLAQVVTELFLGLAVITALALLPAIFLRRPTTQTEDVATRRELGRLL